MSKKILITALASVAAVGLSSAALAQNFNTSNSGIYVGVQAGYGDTHWNDADFNNALSFPFGTGTLSILTNASFKSTGFAGRIFAGYDFNQYLALETGFTYFPKTDLNVTVQSTLTDGAGNVIAAGSKSETGTFNTYGGDLLAKISVPVVDNFGLYAKAGPGYLHTGSINSQGSDDDKTNNVVLVYGFGADYQITPNLIADASFTRYNGNHDTNSKDYQPDADLYALGLAYKFNI